MSGLQTSFLTIVALLCQFTVTLLSRDIRRFCQVEDRAFDLLRQAIVKLGLSARAYDRILKVSRTIADLAGEEGISAEHVGEAIQYRALDRVGRAG